MGRAHPPLGTLLALAMLLSAVPAPVHAHEGPPFPIVVDRPVGPYVVSVWTDPDIGTGTFFVVLEPREGGRLPAGTEVRIGVAPLSGRLEEMVYRATPQPVRYGERHFAEVSFDRGELWRVRVEIASTGGGGEVITEVEATPDGTIGPIGLLLYALPFVAVGFLWLKAVLRRKSGAA